MAFLAQFQHVSEEQKASAVKKLIENSTPDYDFFVMVGLSVLMASLGVISNNITVVIGSMLIAPILYPVLSLALGFTMSDYKVLGRAVSTILKAFAFAVCLSFVTALVFGESTLTGSIVSGVRPSLAYFMVALISGFAVSFSLVRPKLSESFSGIAVSVALIIPLSVVGVALAYGNIALMFDACILFMINAAGIVFASMISFSLLNLYVKRGVAETTLKKEEARVEAEHKEAEEKKLDTASGESNI